MIPAFFGLAGPELTVEERTFIRAARPAGFILFARNCVEPAQLRRLTGALREATGRADLPVVIDQEGGRVARLGPPHWPAFPAPWRFAEAWPHAPVSAIEAARANAGAMAALLRPLDINVDCAPCLDLRHAGGHEVIGDRALGAEPMQVAALGRAMLDGLEAGGVLGMIKHMPGHGRASADSHVEAPLVEADAEAMAADLAPFRALKDAAFGMVAHVRYAAWDEARPASCSPTVIGEAIRSAIGFEGLLVSDDIGMGALHGPMGERARAAIEAGCDFVLHGSGALDEAQAVAAALDAMPPETQARLAAAMSRIADAPESDHEALAAKRDALLAALG